MKKEVLKKSYEEVVRDYGKYTYFKIDTGTIYVVSEVNELEWCVDDATLYVLSDGNVAESLASIGKDDLENGYYTLLKEIHITDFVPAEPVKKYYLYAVPETDYCYLEEEFLGEECGYGRLVGEVSEGFAWYDVFGTVYSIPENTGPELWGVVENIDNPHKWTDEMWSALYGLEKVREFCHYRESEKRERFGLYGYDDCIDAIVEYDCCKRVVRVKDGKPYVFCK